MLGPERGSIFGLSLCLARWLFGGLPIPFVIGVDCLYGEWKGNQVVLFGVHPESSVGSFSSRVFPSATYSSMSPPTGPCVSCPTCVGNDPKVGILDVCLQDDGSLVVGSPSNRSVIDEVAVVPSLGVADF